MAEGGRRSAIHTPGSLAAHMVFPLLLALLAGCGSRIACRNGAGGAIDATCIQNRLRLGDRVWIHPRDSNPIEGTYVGTAGSDTATIVLLEDTAFFNGSHTKQRDDTVAIHLDRITKVEKVRLLPAPFAVWTLLAVASIATSVVLGRMRGLGT